MEYGIYCWLIQSANPGTGIWMGSAKLLAIQVSVPDRNARYFLESLESKGYLKRFVVLRRKTNYPILISRFHCSQGAHKGMMVNAALSMTSTTILYESLPTDCPRAVTEVPQTTAHASPLKTLETLDLPPGETRSKPANGADHLKALTARKNIEARVRREKNEAQAALVEFQAKKAAWIGAGPQLTEEQRGRLRK